MNQASDRKSTYTSAFTQAGLTESQALVYEALLRDGQMTAAKIYQKTPLKKGILYKILDDLETFGLVTKKDVPGKVATFEPAHPDNLKKLLTVKQEQIKNAEQTLDSLWLKLTQDFNAISTRPTVQLFEGAENVHRITMDTLTSKSEIYTYIDSETVNKYSKDFNQEYVKKRRSLKIKKKLLGIDSAYMRGRKGEFDPATTEVRLIPIPLPFATVMHIYDNKVGFVSLEEQRRVGVLIEDKHIATMQRLLFEYVWSTAKPL